jgi:hypothetical protein
MAKGIPNHSHKTRRVRANLDWQEHAACVDFNPAIFFNPDRYTEALSVCAACPVQAPCRELGRGQGDGVWGGKVHQQRRKALA